MIDGRNTFDQHLRNDTKTFENIRKLSTCTGGDYTTVSLFDCPFFSKIISWLQHT